MTQKLTTNELLGNFLDIYKVSMNQRSKEEFHKIAHEEKDSFEFPDDNDDERDDEFQSRDSGL